MDETYSIDYMIGESDYLEKGIYKVDITQFLDLDNNRYVGKDTIDMILNFTKVSKFDESVENILWYSY